MPPSASVVVQDRVEIFRWLLRRLARATLKTRHLLSPLRLPTILKLYSIQLELPLPISQMVENSLALSQPLQRPLRTVPELQQKLSSVLLRSRTTMVRTLFSPVRAQALLMRLPQAVTITGKSLPLLLRLQVCSTMCLPSLELIRF